jgi:hypothetical protein
MIRNEVFCALVREYGSAKAIRTDAKLMQAKQNAILQELKSVLAKQKQPRG